MQQRSNIPGRVRTDSGARAHRFETPAVPDLDTDEAVASAARTRYRKCGLEPIEPDERIDALLAPGEQVIAVRRSVGLDRRDTAAETPAIDSIRGDLYVTSARLVHVGPTIITFELDDIEDAALAGERVLLLLRDGLGIALEADRPRLLRVQIAVARAARTGSTCRRGRPQETSR